MCRLVMNITDNILTPPPMHRWNDTMTVSTDALRSIKANLEEVCHSLYEHRAWTTSYSNKNKQKMRLKAVCPFLYSCNCRCLIHLILYRDARAIILPSRLSQLTWGFLTVVVFLRTARVLLLIIPGSCCSRGNLRSPVREGSFLTWDLHRHWACAGNSRVTLLRRHSLRLLWGLCNAEKVTVNPISSPYIHIYIYFYRYGSYFVVTSTKHLYFSF